MRKLLILILVLLCLPLTVFAGDIPEALMEDQAQIFFGEVLAYHDKKEIPSIVVSPIAVVKGNVKAGTQQIYNWPNPVGNIRVKTGDIYLFTYYDEANYIDIFATTTYDTRTLELKNVEGDMWKRFEKYLNEGRYGEARVEGLAPREEFFLIVASTATLVLIVLSFLIFRKKWAA